MKDTFKSRSWIHDNIASPAVVKQFELLGYNGFLTGTEIDNEAMRNALKQKYDKTSMMIRYRPDKLFTHPKQSSIMCEIKSESRGHKNFAVEFDSFSSTLEWGITHLVVYGFVNIETLEQMYKVTALYCLSSKIPFPNLVYLPNRNGYKQAEERIKEAYPDLRIKVTVHRKGSGTPYFLLPKNFDQLESLDKLICTQ